MKRRKKLNNLLMRLLILWVFAWGNPVFADDLFTPIVKGMQSFLSGLMSIQATATPDQKLVGSFLNPLTSGGSLTGLASASVAQPQGYDKVLTLKFSFQDPKVKDVLINNSTYQEMSVPGLTNRANVGSPMIPYKYTYALIPDGYEVVAVDNQYQQQQEIKNLLLLPEQAALPMATTSSAVFAFNAQAYKDNNPVAPVLTESIQILHRYHLLPILLTPVQYRAVDRVVSYAKGMTVRIYLKKKTTVLQLSVAEEQLKNKIKNRRSAQKSVLGLIENPSDLAPEAQSVAKSLGVQGQTVTSSYDMVIIGPESYRSSVADYISFKASLGQRVYFASMTADIASQNGTDLPMKIRNYITYAYNTYGIQYVLLAGDITKVPARDNIPNYYDVKAIYSDVYYSCLDGTWDENNNGIYGETTDNAMDRLAEVYVGRFAASNTTDLTKMFNKTKTYLSLSPTSSFLKTVSVLGENMDTNNPPETSGTLYDNYMGNIFNNDNKFIAIQHGVYADSANFTNEANSNAAQLYMHDGHGNTNIDMLLTDSDITEGKFSNTLPFIVYSSGCFANNFLNSGAISRYFLQISHGALAFIGNTNYGWYSPGVANGASNVYQAEFYNQVVSGSPQLGKAIALAREKETTSLFYSTDHYGLRDLFFCINLLGDPSVPLRQYNSDIVIPEIQSITYSVGTNCFSASWTITEDVAEYQYSIGTEVNSDNVLPWTTINTANIDQISVVLLSDYTNIFNVKAKNTDGVWSNVASKTLYFLPDITSPSIPTGLSPKNITSRNISITWGASTDDVGVTQYHLIMNANGLTVSQNYVKLCTFDVKNFFYPNTKYDFCVSALDAMGNESDKSLTLSVTTDASMDNFAMSVSLDTISCLAGDQIWLSPNVFDPYNDTYTLSYSGWKTYNRIYSSGSDMGTHNVLVTATDTHGGMATCNVRIVVAMSLLLSNQFNKPTTSSIGLNWSKASTANIGLTGYTLYRNGTPIVVTSVATFSYQGCSYVDSGLLSGTTYNYNVIGNNAENNVVAQSATLSVKTLMLPDLMPPSPPTVTADNVMASSVELSWYGSTDNVGVTGYALFRKGSKIVSTSATTYIDTGLSSNTTYDYNVKAYDASSNVSAMSMTLSVQTTTADSSPPSPPTVTANSIATWSVVLLWDGSSDNVGVTGYCVYRNSTIISTTSATTYNDTGLAENTTYNYNVSAYDHELNMSARSVTFSIKLPDVIVPTAPTVTANGVTTSSIGLIWEGASDNVGVTGYNVYRNGTLIVSTSATTLVDSGLISNTQYNYNVSAYDAAGNVSAKSATISIKTLYVNRAPSLNIANLVTGNEGQLIVLSPNVSDPDGDIVTVSYSGWMTSNIRQTGYSDAGTYNVVVAASDGKGGVATSSVIIVVFDYFVTITSNIKDEIQLNVYIPKQSIYPSENIVCNIVLTNDSILANKLYLVGNTSLFGTDIKVSGNQTITFNEPVRFEYVLPTVNYGKKINVRWWDEQTNSWRQEGIVSVNVTGNRLSFGVLHFTLFGVFEENSSGSSAFTLTALNGPNPFNPFKTNTVIGYTLAEAARVDIKIYALSGREIRSWHSDYGSSQSRAGYNFVTWNGRDSDQTLLANGLYYAIIIAENAGGMKQKCVLKIVVLK